MGDVSCGEGQTSRRKESHSEESGGEEGSGEGGKESAGQKSGGKEDGDGGPRMFPIFYLMFEMEFFTVSCLVFMMLLTMVNWRLSFCMLSWS